jgi:hypothetical protein
VGTWSTIPEADGARENAEAIACMSGIMTAFHAANQQH